MYGLELRGFKAGLAQAKHRSAAGDRINITVRASDVDRARASLGSIWDAILSRGRDVDDSGRCVHCGYDAAGLPELSPCPECGNHLDRAMSKEGQCLFCRFDVSKLARGEVCPECGTDLDCIEAMRAGRAKSGPPRVDL